MAAAVIESGRSRAELLERLQGRSAEIEQAILTRARAVADPNEVGDPAYVEGLRAAVSAGIGYGLAEIERSRLRPPSIPDEILAQARNAARNRVSLDTVLRRYIAGYSVLGDFVAKEAGRDELLRGEELHRLMRRQTELFDRLIVAVTEEHTREAADRIRSPGQHRAECLQRLLVGELTDTAGLGYDFDGWHIGVVADGARAEEAIRAISSSLDRRQLTLDRGGGTLWTWLGGRREVTGEELERLVGTSLPARTSMAVGEPAEGLAGWRLTHRQAGAALSIALHSPGRVVRYGEVSLLASILKDELLVGSLHDLYLKPLAGERDEGETLRATLRAYFAADRNLTSTAASLKVSRQTVSNRLSAVEERIGRPLNSVATEIDAALRLQALGEAKRVLPLAR
jgi:hypothetical protein